MQSMTAEELLRKGIALIREHNNLAALSHLERAYNMRKDPVVQSYLALCIALERGKITDAVALCKDSMLQDQDNPVHYLNLGKIYLKSQKKTDAIETLRKGLHCGTDTKLHDEIKAVLDSVGLRKPPVISFLPRGHFLNKHIGLFLRKVHLR